MRIPIGVRTAVDYRLRMDAAAARIRQALVVDQLPPGYPAPSVELLLTEALRELSTEQDVTDEQVAAFTEADPDAAPPEPDPDPCPLTPRQREVVALLADGIDPHEVAARLVISRASVKTHLDRVRRHPTCRGLTTAGIVALALREGWII